MSPEPYGKPIDGFKTLTTSLEPAGMDLGIDQTPVDKFFVCSGSPAPTTDIATWSLRIDGDASTAHIALSYADLQALPQHTVTSWLECAGNGRAMYVLAGGYDAARDAADTAWTLGAMGIATWSGPRLSDVLAVAGLGPDAQWIAPEGLDVDNREGEAARMSMPLSKALHADTLVALEMNGEALTGAHGFPARLLVPGWVGAYSVKWLDRIEVSTTWVPSWRADTYYVRRTADGTALGPATRHPVKSCLALPWPAEVAPTDRIHGYARSGGGAIESVEWSLDDGPWQSAALTRIESPWAWTPFTIDCELIPGDHQVRTRAVDSAGESQPESMDFHPNTILWNAITRHPIKVI